MNSSANHFPTKWSKKEEEIESSTDYTILIIVVVLVVLVLLIIVILILYWFCYRGKQRNRKISDTGKGVSDLEVCLDYSYYHARSLGKFNFPVHLL